MPIKLMITFVLLLMGTEPTNAVSVRTSVNRISGMQVEASQKLLNYGATIVNQIIEQELGKVSIPEIKGTKDGFDYDVSNCHVKSVSIQSPAASFSVTSGLMIKLTDVSVEVECDWSYELEIIGFPFGSGSLDATAAGGSHVNVNLIPAITTDNKLALTIHDPDIELDDFEIDIHGSWFSWLYDLLVDIFSNDIKNDIIHTATNALTTTVDSIINKALENMNLVFDLPIPTPFNIAEMDFSLTSAQVSNDALTAQCAASVNDTRHPTTNPYPGSAVTITPTPAVVRDGSMLTLTLSSWPFNNALWIFSEANLLEYLVNGTMIPPPIYLNTSFFNIIIPGLAKAFPGAQLQVLLNVQKGFKDRASITTATTLEVKQLPLLFNFTVFNGVQFVPAFTVGCPLDAGADITLDNHVPASETVLLNVTELTCSNISTLWSGYGPVDFSDLGDVVNGVLYLLKPKLNKLIAHGFALPSIDGVTFLNSTISSGNNMLRIGTDITWKPSILDV